LNVLILSQRANVIFSRQFLLKHRGGFASRRVSLGATGHPLQEGATENQ
jgi:hypothetical protein